MEAGAERYRKGSREEFHLVDIEEGSGQRYYRTCSLEGIAICSSGHEDPTRFLNQSHSG